MLCSAIKSLPKLAAASAVPRKLLSASCIVHAARYPPRSFAPSPASLLRSELKRMSTFLSAGAHSAGASSKQLDTIMLNETEDLLCRMLEATCAWLASGKYQPSEETIQLLQASSLKSTTDQPCTARLAGGWVRDKLLNVNSADIDVSLSTYTGYPFALGLTAFLRSEEFKNSSLAKEALALARTLQPTVDSEDDATSTQVMGNIGRIKANPEQSKSLETATAHLLGLSMDFVNLRKEVYEEGSRIPIMTFGTPQEDAERRDLTINSLLFNVHTRQVEDFTGKGLDDLRNGLVRTPLAPLRTFLDDPLRILRCIRFASRFGYRLHQDIVKVLTDRPYAVTFEDERSTKGQNDATDSKDRKEVFEALQHKVSRERFGTEVDKMMTGPDPLLALYLLYRFDLFPLIFHPFSGTSLNVAGSSGHRVASTSDFETPLLALRAARLLDAIWKTDSATDLDGDSSMLSAESSIQAAPLPGSINAVPPPPLPRPLLVKIPAELRDMMQSADNRRRLFFAAALLPLRHVQAEEKKGKAVWAGDSVIEKGLKLSNKVRDSTSAVVKGAAMLSKPALGSFDSGGHGPAAREGLWAEGSSRQVAIGLLLQHPFISNPTLTLSLPVVQLFALVCDLLDLAPPPTSASEEEEGAELEIDESAALSVIELHSEFYKWTQQSGLASRTQERPRLNGNEIQETLGFHPGPMTSRITSAIMAWQLDRSAVEAGSQAERESAEECREWLRTSWERGEIIPLDQRIKPKEPVKKKVKGAGRNDGPRVSKRQKSEE